MVKKAKSQASGDKGGQQTRSDDEILKDRRLLEAFDTADSYLKFLGLGMWTVAMLWLFNFSDKMVVMRGSLYNGGNDVHLIFIVMGFFCRWMSQASPRSWSGWRRVWHLSWCPVCIALALVMGSFLLYGEKMPVETMPCLYIGGGLALFGVGSLATLPGPSLKSGKVANAPLVRCLLVVDGLVLLVLAATIVIGYEWGDVQLPAAAMTAIPMASWAIALMLCSAEAELLAAVPTVAIFCVGATLRSMYVDDVFAAIPAMLVFILHLLPYLPLPPSDVESNPFHMALRKSWRGFVKMLTQPVAGFGDDE